ncbi:hypothetical protein [Aestuariivirga sp.]|uniref:hypothetical protein n=1 Tax=Aestuariivirga sp. TaxID=2650926 RepID=UPI003BA9DE40
MFLHPAWIEREAPLARCPLNSCRRSGTCSHQESPTPCRRTHETKDAARNALADKIARLAAEIIAENPHNRHHAEEGTPEFNRRLKRMYDGIRAADEANSARLMEERRLKGSATPAAPAPQKPPRAKPKRRPARGGAQAAAT